MEIYQRQQLLSFLSHYGRIRTQPSPIFLMALGPVTRALECRYYLISACCFHTHESCCTYQTAARTLLSFSTKREAPCSS